MPSIIMLSVTNKYVMLSVVIQHNNIQHNYIKSDTQHYDTQS
jgi:hypothetical protein